MPENKNLVGVFRDLQRPDSPLPDEDDEGAYFNAVPIRQHPPHRIGKDGAGRASILISVSEGQEGPSPLRLEHLVVRHNVPCRVINAEDEEKEKKFTLLTCVTSAYTPYFLRVGSAVLEELGENPSREDVVQVVRTLADLFDSFGGAATGSLRGLWAELVMIANASQPGDLVDAWHSTPEDRFDFNQAHQRLEVKSTSKESRRHRFSLDQLTPPQGVDVVFASMRVDRAGKGLSVGDLLERIQSRLSEPERAFKLERIVGETLGRDSDRALNVAFDEEVALDSLAFFSPNSIPSPSRDLPPEVSSVRFTSDLSRSSTLDLGEYSEQSGGIWTAVGL
jgi:hypothetical protein